MLDKINRVLKNLHLIVSCAIVVPTAIIYGSPAWLPEHLDIPVNTTDLSNMLKALMCLYIGISMVWILGIWKTEYWKIATQLNVLFMFSLGVGRAISMLMDGWPTGGYIFGITAEFLLGFFALFQLRRYRTND